MEDSPSTMVVLDATKDDRFRDSIQVVGPMSVRFFAGATLIIDGLKVGAVGILDKETWSEFPELSMSLLQEFARAITAMLDASKRRRLIEYVQRQELYASPLNFPSKPTLRQVNKLWAEISDCYQSYKRDLESDVHTCQALDISCPCKYHSLCSLVHRFDQEVTNLAGSIDAYIVDVLNNR